jgi:NAD(P)-dependent dehydrogenase (short-subunit alcohol dehydrogenase family)
MMPNDIFDLDGKVAIVTGGNSGIGLGIAKGLAAAGATIIVSACNQDKTAQAVTEIQALGVQAMGLPTDVQDEASVQAMVKATVHACGRVDILVNNAGIEYRKYKATFHGATFHGTPAGASQQPARAHPTLPGARPRRTGTPEAHQPCRQPAGGPGDGQPARLVC